MSTEDPKESLGEDFTIEFAWNATDGSISNVLVTKNVSSYSRWQRRFRNFLYRRAPWLPNWVTGWKTYSWSATPKPAGSPPRQ